MTDFDAIITDVSPVFTEVFGESIVYRKATGATRTISAVVHRMATETRVTPQARPQIEIEVQNNATMGIAASEINFSTDRVTVAYQRGGTAQTWSIAPTFVSEDAGMIRLSLK